MVRLCDLQTPDPRLRKRYDIYDESLVDMCRDQHRQLTGGMVLRVGREQFRRDIFAETIAQSLQAGKRSDLQAFLRRGLLIGQFSRQLKGRVNMVSQQSDNTIRLHGTAPFFIS